MKFRDGLVAACFTRSSNHLPKKVMGSEENPSGASHLVQVLAVSELAGKRPQFPSLIAVQWQSYTPCKVPPGCCMFPVHAG